MVEDLKVQSLIIIHYTFCRIQLNSPHVPLAVSLMCALMRKKTSGVELKYQQTFCQDLGLYFLALSKQIDINVDW